MENKNLILGDTIQTIIKNTHLNLHLEGWPAAFAVVAICAVAAYAIKEARRSE